ncbi:hypothetical protein SDJN03_12863, partial [Cucurbita argyrosperma subsp. sororia]
MSRDQAIELRTALDMAQDSPRKLVQISTTLITPCAEYRKLFVIGELTNAPAKDQNLSAQTRSTIAERRSICTGRLLDSIISVLHSWISDRLIKQSVYIADFPFLTLEHVEFRWPSHAAYDFKSKCQMEFGRSVLVI